MKLLYIEEFAAKAIAQARTLQSGEFDDASYIVEFIKNNEEKKILNIHCKEYKDTGYIYNVSNFTGQNFIIFDFDIYKDFISQDGNSIITILQKIIKFSLKRWNNIPINNVSEKIINHNDHAILFPFPYSDKNPYKILIDLHPKSEYTSRRNINCFFIANMGYGEFDTIGYEIPNIKNIKKESSEICKIESSGSIQKKDIGTLKVSCLDSNIEKTKSGYISYENWLPNLSRIQKEFILKTNIGNERLEGAAGTGKTLSLVLRAIYLCKNAKSEDKPLKIIFICHSISSKEGLIRQIKSISPIEKILEPEYSKQSIELTTLQEWCTKYLGNNIGQSEVLDADAQECKDVQSKFIAEVISDCMKNDYPSYKDFCSNEFNNFMLQENKGIILDTIISEISITIKGRASGDIETYKELKRLEGSIPLKNVDDFNFIYLIYEKYQELLIELGYFDNDDISLSSALQLASPIWKRRRMDLGYDIIIIDEVHLFSYNELAIFHFLSKDEKDTRIIYAIDKTQAVGDRGLTKKTLRTSLKISEKEEKSSSYKTIFRSSPEIIDLAFSILTSGADMFLNFENPLQKINFSFTTEQEKKSIFPEYYLLPNDDSMINEVFNQVENLNKNHGIKREGILLVSVDMEIHDKISKYIKERNKPCELLRRRGDYTVIQKAKQNNSYILGYIDYIGGLEFDAVIIVGVDKNRVPKYSCSERIIYQNYEWHNRMYVATTRAKYAVIILGNKSYQPSTLLNNAIASSRIKLIDK